ncbi:MAG: hypothetical protein ACFFDG_02920 [Promethearchaeota archaeon]
MVKNKSNEDSEGKIVNNKGKSEKGEIFIKKEAFRNMFTHVLRFGNNALEKSIEVLGICIGKYYITDNKIVIENAIPLIHGDKVEIGFDKEIYELFEQIKRKYPYDLVGYYHSHPSWGLYLSESDLKNLQYFQRDDFPYGFGIVFDHTLMGKEDSWGFDIYRLDDYSKAETYHSVSFEIEIPSSLEYFKWVQKFVEDFQKKDPILIKEINEFVEPIPEDLQEIPISEEIPLIEEQQERSPQIAPIISGIEQGIEKFSNIFTDIIENQMKVWINDINQGTSKGTEYISKAVSKMKDAMNSGLLKVDNWFKKTLNETVNDFKRNLYKSVDKRIGSNKDLVKEISNMKNDFMIALSNLIEDNIKNINNETQPLMTSLSEDLQENIQTQLKIQETITDLKSNIVAIDSQISSQAQDLEKKMEFSTTQLQKIIDEKIEKLSTELQPFKEYNSEIKILLEKLQKVITGFRNLS